MVREGYKQTDVGVIPEDWVVVSLGEVGHSLIGLTYKPENIKSHGTLVLRSSNVQNGHLAYEDNVYVDSSLPLPSRVIVEEGDILICVRNGSKQLIGKCALIDSFAAGSAFGAFMSVLRTSFSSFIFYQFQSNAIKKQIDEIMGATINQITNKDMASFKVPLPTLKEEQTAIATTLSDFDSFITTLEKVIAKKRDIKTATMQQLLTGKTRLPGFGEGKGYKPTAVGVIPEDWDVVNLGQIGQSLIGLTYKPENTSSHGTLVLRSSNVQNGYLAYDNNVYVDSSLVLPSRVIVEEGDILICVRNGSKRLIGKCALIDSTCAGSAFGAFMSVFRTDYFKFVFYQFQSNIMKKQIEEIMGATINQITNKDMAEFKVPLPALKEEQEAIATILSDIDTEISQLESRLHKTKAIKKSMMQELLTGRTRLI